VGEREGPKLLLNQGHSEPCYATGVELLELPLNGLNWVSDATRSIDEIKHVSQYVPSRILAGRGVTVEQARSAVTPRPANFAWQRDVRYRLPRCAETRRAEETCAETDPDYHQNLKRFLPLPMCRLSTESCENHSCSFCLILLTKKHKLKPTSLAEVIRILRHVASRCFHFVAIGLSPVHDNLIPLNCSSPYARSYRLTQAKKLGTINHVGLWEKD